MDTITDIAIIQSILDYLLQIKNIKLGYNREIYECIVTGFHSNKDGAYTVGLSYVESSGDLMERHIHLSESQVLSYKMYIRNKNIDKLNEG